MTLLRQGEKLHVIERRAFDGDARRHFVGEVEAANDVAVRVRGYTFVCNPMTGNFDRREPLRTRIIPLSAAGVVVYVIPEDIEIEAVRYEWEAGNRLVVRAGHWELSLDEFASAR
jgi:hypothetical protein